MESVPSVAEGRGKFRAGTEAASWAANSVVPRCSRVSAVTTSTGATVSRRERLATRVPVTTMSSTAVGSAEACWAAAAPASSSVTLEEARNRAERKAEVRFISRGLLF
ncbi:hypothetical protein D3C87_1500360 [compost metagenome]